MLGTGRGDVGVVRDLFLVRDPDLVPLLRGSGGGGGQGEQG